MPKPKPQPPPPPPTQSQSPPQLPSNDLKSPSSSLTPVDNRSSSFPSKQSVALDVDRQPLKEQPTFVERSSPLVSSGSSSSSSSSSSGPKQQKKRRKRGFCGCCCSKRKGRQSVRDDGSVSSSDSLAPPPATYNGEKPRRTRIPNRPNLSMSLWGVIKNAIGKDLSKLPLPVHFNEPLSMLQRLTEDYEYSSLLDAAAETKLSWDQMCLVAAFSVSSYASTAVRVGKPFNPLLGETFECDRMDDLGFKCICEQVSHHPPVASQHCVGKQWVCWQEFSMASKFTGNSIEINPLGIAHLMFPASGNHYTWRKVQTAVHNIILGSLWIDQQGEMEIFNHKTGDKCRLNYLPTGTFGGNAKKVEGKVTSKGGDTVRTLLGYWDKQLESFDVLNVSEKGKLTLGAAKLLWTKSPSLPDYEKFYFFTLLACQLNEMEDDVAPTDSRRRPDQRIMESGGFDEANLEKVRLEEKQRTARKKREAAAKNLGTAQSVASTETEASDVHGGDTGYSPKWFELKKDPLTGKPIHVFTEEYWACKQSQDWSRCPDIY